MPASEALELSGAEWAAALGDTIIPLVGALAMAVNAGNAALRGADRSLKMGLALMTKALLQNLSTLHQQPGFAKLWDRMLQVRPHWPYMLSHGFASQWEVLFRRHWESIKVEADSRHTCSVATSCLYEERKSTKCADVIRPNSHVFGQYDSAAQVLYDCKRNRSEILAEAVPEALKNVLLVMAAQGVLAPSWTVCLPSRVFLLDVPLLVSRL